MEIIRTADCGNSPKNQLAETLTIALLTSDLRPHAAIIAEDAQWHQADGTTLSGRDALLKEMERTRSRSIVTLTVTHAITHGKVGAVNGEIHYEDSKEGFCFMLAFSNTKGTRVRQITSYHTKYHA